MDNCNNVSIPVYFEGNIKDELLEVVNTIVDFYIKIVSNWSNSTFHHGPDVSGVLGTLLLRYIEFVLPLLAQEATPSSNVVRTYGHTNTRVVPSPDGTIYLV